MSLNSSNNEESLVKQTLLWCYFMRHLLAKGAQVSIFQEIPARCYYDAILRDGSYAREGNLYGPL